MPPTRYDCWNCWLKGHKRLAYKYRVIDRGLMYGCTNSRHRAIEDRPRYIEAPRPLVSAR